MKETRTDSHPQTPRKILRLFLPYKGLLIAALLMTALSSSMNLAMIGMVRPFIDGFVGDAPHSKTLSIIPGFSSQSEQLKETDQPSKDPVHGIDVSRVKNIIFIIMTLFIMFGITSGIGMYLSSLCGQRIVLDLRMKVFSHLQELSLSFFENRQTGGIMSWVTNDINVFRTFSTTLLNGFIDNFVQVFGALAINFALSWKLSLISLFIIPLLGWVINNYGKRMRTSTRRVQDRLSDISSVLHESISAIQVVKAFGTEKYENERFSDQNKKAFKAEMYRAKITAILHPAIQLVVAIGILAILFVGIHEVRVNPKFTFGSLFVFVALLSVVSERGRRLGSTYGSINELYSAGDRLFELLEEKPKLAEIENPIELKNVEGNVTFNNVSFSYDGIDTVLQDINLDVPKGKVVAFVGPSGAGKSSLVKLIPRFYDPTKGSILIDGIDIKNVTFSSLTAQLGIVPQETILFGTSVKENIAYGRLDATETEIIEAAKAANAHEFIEKLPLGYETVVGERGSKLSGGQAQRISIARAILKNPRILILDEATSSLDAQSEELVQQALEKLMQGRTTFIIAHRLTTIHNAHEIVVLKSGRIVQRGTHDELMKEDGLYRNLYKVQVQVDTKEIM
jgi:subfamily B ATP-binding cassette protein MsbA